MWEESSDLGDFWGGNQGMKYILSIIMYTCKSKHIVQVVVAL